jgi:membrane fusion protein (multidrug efflux system)
MGNKKETNETYLQSIERQGYDRRDFLKFVAYIGAYMGVQSSAIGQIAKALEKTPRLPVIWEHFQECTCCSESFIRSDHPIVADIILDKISLDYTLTLMAASGHQAEAAKQEAQSQLQILQDQQKASAFQRTVATARTNVSNKQVLVAEANVKKAQAALQAANLNLSYTVVTASIDGQVSTVDLQPGQLVQPGQSLFYIINNNEVWVVANFKETQLNKMRQGQKVKLKIDAFPGDEFEGKVSSFSPATGSKFSLLPPDNASGNFVKTVQRLPIRINFTENNDQEKVKLLRSGMNVDADVLLK